MKVFNAFLSVIFGLALLGVLFAGGYFLIRFIVNVFAKLEPQLAIITAIASVTAMLCAMVIAWSLKSPDHRQYALANCIEKAQLYRCLLNALYRWNTLESSDHREADIELLELKQRLALWSSPNVITAYVQLERLTRQETSRDDDLERLLQQLITEMRKDLGQIASNIKQEDLLYLFKEKQK